MKPNNNGGSILLHFPILSSVDVGIVRSPGPGLGNLLFPVSRALVGQDTYGGRLVYPTMRQIKVGTFLRNERDKRTYGDVFRARRASEWTAWIHARLRRSIPETDITVSTNSVVRYEGLGRYFHDLAGHSKLIENWIDSNARYAGSIEGKYDIGIHVRLGDFSPYNGVDRGHSIRQRMSWYRDAIEFARRQVGGAHARMVLFTDEDPSLIETKLKLASLQRDPSRNAITAIRNLSKARVIVTSRSTFSMWAVFLGGSDAIWSNNISLSDSFPVRLDKDHFL